MRSTYYTTEDKIYLKQATKIAAISYLLMIAYISFFIWYSQTQISMFHDDSRSNSIILGMLFNFLFSLTIVILSMISIMHSADYKTTKPTHDRLAYLGTSTTVLNIALIIATIVFSFLNVSYLLAL